MARRESTPPPARPSPEPAPPGAAKLLVIVGPTASGKSALALALAGLLDGEIISADSQQVYRGLDIGTAKPTAAEQAAVPHHLVDVADPRALFSAADFARRADRAIEEIRARGRLPIVAGGTGLWVRALLLGLMDAPERDEALRQRLEQEAAAQGREALHRRLAQIDPPTAAEIPAQNLVRIIRALELFELTGEPPSVLRARHGFGRLRYDARVLGLEPPRELLYARIDSRARQMFERGLLDEVRGLLAEGLADAPAMKALGYREAMAVLDGSLSEAEAIARTAQGSRRYAKRQLTWFRADPLVRWLPFPPDPGAVVAELAPWLGER